MNLMLRCTLALAPLVLVACGVAQQKTVAKAAVNTTSESQRKTSYEATAQLLDEKPELVDEFYGVMRLHPKAMDRFLANASTDLDQKWLAKQTAVYLVKNPAGVEEVLNATIPAIAKEPKARAAMTKALAAHADATVDILTDDPVAMSKVVKALLANTEKKPAARKNLLTAVHENRAQAVAFVKDDPAFARAIAVEVVKEIVKDKPTLEKVLAAAGALDTPNAPLPGTASVKAKGEGPTK